MTITWNATVSGTTLAEMQTKANQMANAFFGSTPYTLALAATINSGSTDINGCSVSYTAELTASASI